MSVCEYIGRGVNGYNLTIQNTNHSNTYNHLPSYYIILLEYHNYYKLSILLFNFYCKSIIILSTFLLSFISENVYFILK